VTSLVVVGLLMLGSACDAGPAIEGAQTAVTGAQTALPGLQATAEAGATSVAGVLGADPQAIATQLQALLAGVSVDMQTTPAGASNDAVTQVRIAGTDTRGTFAQLDSSARQAAAGAAMQIGGQYFPNATITLSLVDGAGNTLLSATKAPGQAPSIQ
jgi:hypothetical protein